MISKAEFIEKIKNRGKGQNAQGPFVSPVQSLGDARFLMMTLRAAGVDALPDLIVNYFATNWDTNADSFLDQFAGIFPYTTFLKRLCSSVQSNEPTNTPLPALERCEKDTVGSVITLLKWQHRHGLIWNAKTCSYAAQLGWLDCLTFLHDMGCMWDEATCSEAALGGHLECLQYAHTHACPWTVATVNNALKSKHFECFRYANERGCPVAAATCTEAARAGDISILEALCEQKCPRNTKTCTAAAGAGNFDCLMVALKHGCPWDMTTSAAAAQGGHLEILTYLCEHGCPLGAAVCQAAARGNRLDCLRYLRERGCPWDVQVAINAADVGALECLKYARENGCPWNTGVLRGAVFSGKIECVKYILDSNYVTLGRTALMITTLWSSKSVQILKYLHEERGWPLGSRLVLNCVQWHSDWKQDALRYCLEQGCPVDAGTMCAAASKSLEKVKLLREFGCPWDARAMNNAAVSNILVSSSRKTNLDCLRYLLENGCPGRETVCKSAALSLPTLQLIHEYGCPLLPEAYLENVPFTCLEFLFEHDVPWHADACQVYALRSDLKALRYARERGAPWDERACAAAVQIPFGRFHRRERVVSATTLAAQAKAIKCLQYLHAQGCPWDASTCVNAARENNQPCLEFALTHGCPRYWTTQMLQGVAMLVTGRNKGKVSSGCKVCARCGVSNEPELDASEQVDMVISPFV